MKQGMVLEEAEGSYKIKLPKDYSLLILNFFLSLFFIFLIVITQKLMSSLKNELFSSWIFSVLLCSASFFSIFRFLKFFSVFQIRIDGKKFRLEDVFFSIPFYRKSFYLSELKSFDIEKEKTRDVLTFISRLDKKFLSIRSNIFLKEKDLEFIRSFLKEYLRDEA